MNPGKKITGKQIGFYLTMAMAALCVITAITYLICYGNQARYMSWPAFGVLLAGSVWGAAWSCARKYELAAAGMAATSFASLMLYIQIIYMYIVVVYVGIDLKTVEFKFVLATAFFVVCFLANLVTLFLPQVTKKEDHE